MFFLLRMLPFIDYVVSGDVYSDTWKVENLLTWSIPERYPSGWPNPSGGSDDIPHSFLLR